MITYHKEVQQKSDEWFKLRCGLLTGSLVSQFFTLKKNTEISQDKFNGMVYELAAQRISNFVEPSFTSYHTDRGNIEEIYARQYYNDNYSPIDECGFVTRDIDSLMKVGFSPDGLIGDDGLIEIKSRIQKFQIETIVNNEIPAQYMPQVQFGFYVTQRKWCDFIQYSNGLPLFVKRVLPDDAWQLKIESAIEEIEYKILDTMQMFWGNSKDLVKTERLSNYYQDGDQNDDGSF